MDKDITSIQETTLKDVLAVEDELNFYEVINQETSIFDIEEIFTQRIKEKETGEKEGRICERANNRYFRRFFAGQFVQVSKFSWKRPPRLSARGRLFRR